MQKIKIRREVKIGILLTLTLFLFVWGVNYLRGTDIFTPQIRFHIVYDQVPGLMETNPVTINGVKVGQVHRIAFHPDESGQIVVTANADRQVDIPVNSVARLTSEIIGTNSIIVELGDHPQIIDTGDTLRGIKDPGITEQIERQIGPIKDQAELLMIRADTLLYSLNQILSQENRQKIISGMDSFENTMASMESSAEELDKAMQHETARVSRILENAEAITRNLDDNREVINHILRNVTQISDQLASDDFQQTIMKAGTSVQELSLILEKINRGEGSAGMLLHDAALYKNLSRSSDELEKLLEDIRMHPERYFRISIFGR